MYAILLRSFYALVLLLGVSSNAWSALVTVNFTGAITGIAPEYTGPLTSSSVVNGSAVYESTLLSGLGSEVIHIDADPSYKLTFNLGSNSFHENDDQQYGSGYPILFFTDGVPVGLNFWVDPVEPSTELSVWDNQFALRRYDINKDVVTGTLQFTPVPLPAAIWLFAAGLAPLAFRARRRRA